MSGPHSPYTVIETDHFKKNLNYIRSMKVDEGALQDVLIGVKWALGENPLDYEVVKDTNHLRLIKTQRVDRGLGSVPQMRIWFKVVNDSVEILSAETLDVFL